MHEKAGCFIVHALAYRIKRDELKGEETVDYYPAPGRRGSVPTFFQHR